MGSLACCKKEKTEMIELMVICGFGVIYRGRSGCVVEKI